MGLTCYHVIRPCLEGFSPDVANKKTLVEDGHVEYAGGIGDPVKDSDAWKADVNGLEPQGTRKMVECPPRVTHNFNVGGTQVFIERASANEKASEDKDALLHHDLVSFFDRGR